MAQVDTLILDNRKKLNQIIGSHIFHLEKHVLTCTLQTQSSMPAYRR